MNADSRHFDRTDPLAWLLGLAAALGLAGCTPQTPDWLTLRVMDLDGQTHHPLAQPGLKAAVFLFLANECPIANRAAPEIQRLHREFAPQGVSFWLVHADADETPESIRRHAAEYSLPGTLVKDARGDLVRLAEARFTPQAVVVLPDGRWVYRGRLDDRYVALGQQRTVVTQRDVAEVLSAVIAGRTLVPTNTVAVGCHIPGLR